MSIGTEPRRHPLHAIFLQIGIRIRYAFESAFGLKPLFGAITAYPSKWRPKNAPKYDTITQVGFMWIWVISACAREIPIIYMIMTYTGILSLMNCIHDWLSQRLINQFKAVGFTSADREIPIPEYDWKNGDPETFHKTFVARPHPVILRGFMDNTDLLKKLNWDSVLNKYGEEDVFLTKKELDGYPGKLKEVNNPAIYLHNSEVLFNKYPAIRDLFEYARVEPYLKMKIGYEQFFIGREGTGTPFHHAAVYNMFYQIDGKKHWWFVDPYDTYLAYPLTLLGKAANFSFCLWPLEYNTAAFPLFAYCPVYSAVLNPGDVLFNPPWWWHAIKNVTETTVAVASRWHTNGIAGHKFLMTEEDYDTYRLGPFLFFLGFGSWQFLHGILQTPSPRFDEHVTLRESRNRFVHRQRQMAADGGLKVGGVTAKF